MTFAPVEVVPSWNDEHTMCRCGDPKTHQSPCGYSVCEPCSKFVGYPISHGYAQCPPVPMAPLRTPEPDFLAYLRQFAPHGGITTAPKPVTAKTTRAKVVEVRKTMTEHPVCLVCGFSFTAAITYCPHCGARR